MADVRFTSDLGPNVAPRELVDTLAALADVCDGARVFAESDARASAGFAATRTVRRVVQYGPDQDQATDFPDLATFRGMARYRTLYRLFDLGDDVDPPFLASIAPTQALYERQFEIELRERVSVDPVLRSMTYANPVEAIIEASGGCLLALAIFAAVIRDWRPRRRIAAAAAADAEHTQQMRAAVRAEVARRYIDRELSATPDEIIAALGDGPIAAMVRLAEIEAKINTPDQ